MMQTGKARQEITHSRKDKEEMLQRIEDVNSQVKGMTFIRDLLSQFDGVKMESFEGGYVRVTFQIELPVDPSTAKTVQLMVQTDADEDSDQGMDARVTSARVENKNSIHFQNTGYLDDLDKKLAAAVKRRFTLK